MNNEIGSRSPRALFDLEEVIAGMAVVAELKVTEGGVASQCWISGLTTQGKVALLLQIQMGLSGQTEAEGRDSLLNLMPAIVKLAQTSASAAGLQVPVLLPRGWKNSDFALAHLRLLDVAGVLEDSSRDLAEETARQYELCQAFGVTRQVELLAEYLNLPVSTVRRRLARSRDMGYLPKRRALQEGGASS